MILTLKNDQIVIDEMKKAGLHGIFHEFALEGVEQGVFIMADKDPGIGKADYYLRFTNQSDNDNGYLLLRVVSSVDYDGETAFIEAQLLDRVEDPTVMHL